MQKKIFLYNKSGKKYNSTIKFKPIKNNWITQIVIHKNFQWMSKKINTH